MKGVRELNLELGRPSVEMALARLDSEISACRRMKLPMMKLIHGYGSHGAGSKIRTAVRKGLAARVAAGEFQVLIRGEDFSIFSEDTRRAFALCPALRQDSDLERCNQGVTFLVL